MRDAEADVEDKPLEAADPQTSAELPENVTETQHLIAEDDIAEDDITASGNARPPLMRTRRVPSSHERSEIFCPLLILSITFFGVAFYFTERPKPGDWATSELEIPRGSRDIVTPTILVSIDGFRHEYLSRRNKDADGKDTLLAPNLNAIAKNGVYATDGMQPVVPTITFPNHWSLVTGLYPENSGIIGNTMYDPVKKSWFHLDRVHPDWWFGTPIWQTVAQTPRTIVHANGSRVTMDQNYTSACVFWPGSNVPKHAPDAFWEYNHEISYKARVDQVVALLHGNATNLNRKAHFVTLYFEGVDRAGHKHGPHSHQVAAEIAKVDDSIGYLLSNLERIAPEEYNIVVVSDHGMTGISEDRTIDLGSIIKPGTTQDIVTSPMGLFLNMTIPGDELYASIKNGLKDHEEHVSVYRKETLPERWHLRESQLITPVVTMATLGWTITYPHQHFVPDTDKPLERQVRDEDERSRKVVVSSDKGSHGYDNTFEDMQAIFLAQGPAFKSGATLKNMHTIDLYEMLCYMFSGQPAPNNGTLATTLSTVLKS